MSAFLGESYDYWKSIKQPSEMGMSPSFSLGALATNVDGLLSYVEVLISGSGNASVTGQPLGNKFFLKTTGKCSKTTIEKWRKEREEDAAWETAYQDVIDKERTKQISEDEATKLKNALNEQKKQTQEKRDKDKVQVDRYMYVNNIPDGSIPFIANGADGRTFNDLRGLIPGALGNLGALSPVQLFNGFTAGTYPDCAEITLETVNNDNVKENKTHHIALVEMVELNPCTFPEKRNPASGKICRNMEDFDSMTSVTATKEDKEKNLHQYKLVSENGESVGIYETGSLAGSSGVAYQTTHRSPLSFNMDLTKSSPMTELSFSKFGSRKDFNDKDETKDGMDTSDETELNAREVIEKHNANVSTFYNSRMDDLGATNVTDSQDKNDLNAMFNRLVTKLLSLFNKNGVSSSSSSSSSIDYSDIRGDTMSQVYYYGITAVLLYLFYKILYSRNK